MYFRSGGNYYSASGAFTSGVAAVTPAFAYKNGVALGALTGEWTGTTTYTIKLGGQSINTDAITECYGGAIQAFAIYNTMLTPAQVWLASQQMKYCDVIPDYNAWARQRRYWYAGAAAGMLLLPGDKRGHKAHGMFGGKQ
jgi:hypothetical protein